MRNRNMLWALAGLALLLAGCGEMVDQTVQMQWDNRLSPQGWWWLAAAAAGYFMLRTSTVQSTIIKAGLPILAIQVGWTLWNWLNGIWLFGAIILYVLVKVTLWKWVIGPILATWQQGRAWQNAMTARVQHTLGALEQGLPKEHQNPMVAKTMVLLLALPFAAVILVTLFGGKLPEGDWKFDKLGWHMQLVVALRGLGCVFSALGVGRLVYNLATWRCRCEACGGTSWDWERDDPCDHCGAWNPRTEWPCPQGHLNHPKRQFCATVGCQKRNPWINADGRPKREDGQGEQEDGRGGHVITLPGGGEDAPHPCHQCGQEVEAGTAFCGNCQAPQTGGHRRQGSESRLKRLRWRGR